MVFNRRPRFIDWIDGYSSCNAVKFGLKRVSSESNLFIRDSRLARRAATWRKKSAYLYNPYPCKQNDAERNVLNFNFYAMIYDYTKQPLFTRVRGISGLCIFKKFDVYLFDISIVTSAKTCQFAFIDLWKAFLENSQLFVDRLLLVCSHCCFVWSVIWNENLRRKACPYIGDKWVIFEFAQFRCNSITNFTWTNENCFDNVAKQISITPNFLE